MSEKSTVANRNDCPVAGQFADRDAAVAKVYTDFGMRHPDFNLLQPVMLHVAEAFLPDMSRMILSEYLECLYCIAKHADFAAPIRDQILLQAAVPASELKM